MTNAADTPRPVLIRRISAELLYEYCRQASRPTQIVSPTPTPAVTSTETVPDVHRQVQMGSADTTARQFSLRSVRP